jgi:hypothetical protein
MTTQGTFARILVPTDFSRGSERTWGMAQKLGRFRRRAHRLARPPGDSVLPATPLNMEMLLEAEERKAELRSLQAEHQLGIPRADEATAPAARVFEGPFTTNTLLEFSAAGRCRPPSRTGR